MEKVVLLALAISLGCGSAIRRQPASVVTKPSGKVYCTQGLIEHPYGISMVYVCTPSKELCERGVQKADSVSGKLLGVKTVADCEELFF